jgi:hypothetical protein
MWRTPRAKSQPQPQSYFPVPKPIATPSSLLPSSEALIAYPHYRALLQPQDELHTDRYNKSVELLRTWENIAERYTAVDPEDDEEVDVATGEIIFKGQRIARVEPVAPWERDSHGVTNRQHDNETDGSDGENETDDEGHVGRSNELDTVKGTATRVGEGDWDTLDHWGDESQMDLQMDHLPAHWTAAPKPWSAEDQAELDAFLRDERSRRKESNEEADAEEEEAAHSSSQDQDPILDGSNEAEPDELGGWDFDKMSYQTIQVTPAILKRLTISNLQILPTPITSFQVKQAKQGQPSSLATSVREDGSPLKRQKLTKPLLENLTKKLDIPSSPTTTKNSKRSVPPPSRDSVQFCSDALAEDSPVESSSPSRVSSPAIRRGRVRSTASSLYLSSRTPLNTARSLRDSSPENDVFDSQLINGHFVREQPAEPYYSRSSRKIKTPQRLGVSISWAEIARWNKPKLTPKLAPINSAPLPSATRRRLEVYVELPPLPSDWTKSTPRKRPSTRSPSRERTDSSIASLPPMEEMPMEEPCLSRSTSLLSLTETAPALPSIPLPSFIEPGSVNVYDPPPSPTASPSRMEPDAPCVLDSRPDIVETIEQAINSNTERVSSPVRITGIVDHAESDSEDEVAVCDPPVISAQPASIIEPFVCEIEAIPSPPCTQIPACQTPSLRRKTKTPASRSARRYINSADIKPRYVETTVKPEFYLQPDDDPLMENTLTSALDELDMELTSRDKKPVIPCDTIILGTLDAPIWVGDDEDELSGWDIDGW